jgi:hypothetical protein
MSYKNCSTCNFTTDVIFILHPYIDNETIFMEKSHYVFVFACVFVWGGRACR